ncbi:MAG TPA: branched-chain amino acid ABC transporter permease [Streptosporangiaceae bacterium]|nr:branched-chain amino acid ABC transporter permease [Streptosporangiaceae bacterium]
MASFAKAIVDGILGGAVYALMAAGLTLIFGVLDIINIAQGILVILAAYLSYALSVHLHLDPLLGLLITIPVMFLLGVFIEWAFIRRLRGRERTAMSLLVSYAVAVIIEGVLYQSFGSTPVTLQSWYATSTLHVFGFFLPYIYLIGFGLAVVALAAIYVMLYRTTFGRTVRATVQDKVAARLIGINVDRIAALTFGIGVAVTAAGGMVFGMTNAFNPDSGYDLISRLLSIVILGGLGSIGGALAAAMFMVTAEEVVNIWQPTWATAVYYVVLVIVLVVKPAGLFGKQAARAQ